MDLVYEAGAVGLLTLALFAVGVVRAARAKARAEPPLAAALPFVIAVLASGELGQGLGQRNVRAALDRVPDLVSKVELLNVGTGEAAACLLLSGAAALLLSAVAGALGVVGDED